MPTNVKKHFVLDCVLSAVLEMRQKYPNAVILLKQVNVLGAITSLSAQLLHQLLATTIEALYQPRSNQVNPIIVIHTSKQKHHVYIRCLASPLSLKYSCRLSEPLRQPTIFQPTTALTEICLIIPELLADNQNLV